MSRRGALLVLALALAASAVHLGLVRAMAHGHVAHVLLGSGNASPPIGAALLAASLVLVRFAAVVLAPGAVLAAAASLLAHVALGPPRGEARRVAQLLGTGTTSGAGTRSDAAGSAAGTGASIEGRGTK